MPDDNKNLITFVVKALPFSETFETYTYFVVDPAASAGGRPRQGHRGRCRPAAAAQATPHLLRVACSPGAEPAGDH